MTTKGHLLHSDSKADLPPVAYDDRCVHTAVQASLTKQLIWMTWGTASRLRLLDLHGPTPVPSSQVRWPTLSCNVSSCCIFLPQATLTLHLLGKLVTTA